MDLTEPDRRALLTLLLAGGRSPPRRALLDAFDAPSQIWLPARPPGGLPAAMRSRSPSCKRLTPRYWTPPCAGARNQAIT